MRLNAPTCWWRWAVSDCDAGRRACVARRRCRSRSRKRFCDALARLVWRVRPRHRGRYPVRARSRAPTMPRRLHRQGLAHDGRRTDPASCTRSTSRDCRLVMRALRSRKANARPTPSSRCRSRSAMISHGSKLPASDRRGNHAAGQALAPALHRRGHRLDRRYRAAAARLDYYLTRALGPFADVRLAERGSPAQAVSQFIEQHLSVLALADVGNVGRRVINSRIGSRRLRSCAFCRAAARRR